LVLNTDILLLEGHTLIQYSLVTISGKVWSMFWPQKCFQAVLFFKQKFFKCACWFLLYSIVFLFPKKTHTHKNIFFFHKRSIISRDLYIIDAMKFVRDFNDESLSFTSSSLDSEEALSEKEILTRKRHSEYRCNTPLLLDQNFTISAKRLYLSPPLQKRKLEKFKKNSNLIFDNHSTTFRSIAKNDSEQHNFSSTPIPKRDEENDIDFELKPLEVVTRKRNRGWIVNVHNKVVEEREEAYNDEYGGQDYRSDEFCSNGTVSTSRQQHRDTGSDTSGIYEFNEDYHKIEL